MKNIIDCLIRGILIASIIIGIGYLIVHLLFDDPQKLDLILFILGAIPIIIFLPSVFSQSKIGLHSPKVFFRRVDTLEKRVEKDNEKQFPALSYVFAGVLTWLFSWIIY